MNKFRKSLCLMLAAVLLLSFTACGEKTPEPIKDPGKPTSPAIDLPLIPSGGGIEDPAKKESVIPFDTEQEFKDFLYGTWANQMDGATFTVGFCSDGTLIIFNDMEMECYAYAGTWDLERLYAEENEVPDLLVMPLTDYDDEYIQGLTSAGDYLFTKIDTDGPDPVIYMVQANNGDSLYDIYYDSYELVLSKISDTVSFENPAADRFYEQGEYLAVCGKWTLVSGEIEGWEWDAKEEGLCGELELDMEFNASFKDSDADGNLLDSFSGIQWWPDPGMVSYYVDLEKDDYGPVQQVSGPKGPGAYNAWSVFFRGDENNYFVCSLTGENTLTMTWYQFGGDEPAVCGLNFVRQ